MYRNVNLMISKAEIHKVRSKGLCPIEEDNITYKSTM